MITLVTGPVRAGKSTFALQLARESGRTPVYVATSDHDPADPEMATRVERHRIDRAGMRCIETSERAGPGLLEVLAAAPAGDVLVVDSLGGWLSSHLLVLATLAASDPPAAARALEQRAAPLLEVIGALACDAVIVAEEAGWGVVPPTALGRLFRDQLGRTTAQVAGRAARAYLIVAGFAIDLARAGRRISD